MDEQAVNKGNKIKRHSLRNVKKCLSAFCVKLIIEPNFRLAIAFFTAYFDCGENKINHKHNYS